MVEEKQRDYKSTLNLPQTDFAMKANLAQREPEMLQKWQATGVYASLRKKSAGKPKYILHDGPPYANGKIHIGHALNKTLKDIIVKYKSMQGFDALYVPGWDCHGLPIEHQCLKDMGKRKEEVERVAFRKEARKYAEKFVGIQREEFKRLAIFGEWDKPYLTMNYAYQASIAESFLKLYEDDYIVPRLKPVPWCWDCETALADAELEYEDKTDDTVYVSFLQIGKAGWKDDLAKLPDIGSYSFLVWTTTPWTLPANVGLAVHPNLEYVFVKTDRGNFIFAEALLHSLITKLGIKSHTITGRVKGKILEGFAGRHPFVNLPAGSRVILADYVSEEDGTGIVHIAPGHGEDDYVYGFLENNLPILSPVNHWGKYTKEFPEGEGLHVLKAGNQKIIEILQSNGALVHTEKYTHSYPHCWRCKKPIIFRATPQWFMKIDHDGLRGRMAKAIQSEIQFTPDSGKKRIGSMVETRPDWCLSRQRYWGVPIPIIRCESCGKDFVNETKDNILKLFREFGADIWYEKKVEEFFSSKPSCCEQLQEQRLKKEEDILDVWFDSGVSHQAVLKQDSHLKFPADLYLEGSDQHRGWFQSSLTASMAIEGQPPFKGVLTHGFVVDGEGKKMSKSAGNVVAPQDVMKEFGADILRLWVSSCDYQYDVRLNADILRQLADSYRKIRNTFRYMLSNLYDFDPVKDRVAVERMDPWDQWAVERTNAIVQEIEDRYEKFEFHQIYQLIHLFCVTELSGYYFDGLKDILYTFGKTSARRRSAQTAISYILKRLVKVLAPILPFTMEEVWWTYALEPETASVHISEWKAADRWAVDGELYRTWQDVKKLREAVTPFLEKKREEKLIGANLDAKVSLGVDHPKAAAVIQSLLAMLPQVFVVSQVAWMAQGGEKASFASAKFPGEEIGLRVTVEKAEGQKCERCWNYAKAVGKHAGHPGLCQKCLTAIGE